MNDGRALTAADADGLRASGALERASLSFHFSVSVSLQASLVVCLC
jgi:hypothetical protein